MNNGLKYVTVETVSSVRAGFMRGRGSIAWVVVPFEGAKDESKASRSLYSINSRFWFLSNRGALVRSTVKAISITSPIAIMLARLIYVKMS